MYECEEKEKANNHFSWCSSIFFINIVRASLIDFAPDEMEDKTDEDDKEGDHRDDNAVYVGHPTIHNEV